MLLKCENTHSKNVTNDSAQVSGENVYLKTFSAPGIGLVAKGLKYLRCLFDSDLCSCFFLS